VTYHVVIRHDAGDELTAIWSASSDPDRVLKIYEQLIYELAETLDEIGESRDDSNTRIVFRKPLGFLYTVDNADLIVTILRVWQYA
jgi:hypothetical protein